MELAVRIGTMARRGAPVPPPFDGNEIYGDCKASQLGSDVLLKFSEETSVLKAVKSFEARILAIGGGGGGGATWRGRHCFSGYFGGGGGGGAGGFVETNGLFGAGLLSLSVGAGGAGGLFAGGSSTRRKVTVGGNGGNTVIRLNGSDWITAYGGGGGGGETDGNGGGSGGGGSMYRKSSSEGTPNAGGSGINGQGNAGGAGDAPLYGGGGGGAGGAGADASTSNPTGGDGKSSDITGELKWYAGGGGGGHSEVAVTTVVPAIKGGSGVGGDGGVGTMVPPTAGAAGTGSGGGGCNANQAMTTTTGGAAGGSGVVYVRVKNETIDNFRIYNDLYAELSVEPNAGDSVSFMVEGISSLVSFGDGSYFLTNGVDNLVTHTYAEKITNAKIRIFNGKFRISSQVSAVSKSDVVGIPSTFLKLKRENGSIFNSSNTAIMKGAFSGSTENCHFEIPSSITEFQNDSYVGDFSAFGELSVIDFQERSEKLNIIQGSFEHQKICISRSTKGVFVTAGNGWSNGRRFTADWYFPASMVDVAKSTSPFNAFFDGTIHQIEGSIYE